MIASSSMLGFFTIGLGPSCDHSVLPMRAAGRFCERLIQEGVTKKVHRLKVQVHGRFAHFSNLTGVCAAILLGLQGATPNDVEVDSIPGHLAGIRSMKSLRLPWGRVVAFNEARDIVFDAAAEDGIEFVAFDDAGNVLLSICGIGTTSQNSSSVRRFPFQTGRELVRLSRECSCDISTLMLRHEASIRPEPETREALWYVWKTMRQSVERGCAREQKPDGKAGPGCAAWLNRELSACQFSSLVDPLRALDWVDLWAIAVSEENAAGGRVVAVPTNETAGILPAVLHYIVRVHDRSNEEGITRFMLTAGAIAAICAGPAIAAGVETSLGCAMAAGAMCDALGGSTAQVVNAAALGLESHRGIRFTAAEYPAIGAPNAIAAVTAINTARLARHTGQGDDGLLLDRVISHLASSKPQTARGVSQDHTPKTFLTMSPFA